MLLQVYSSKYIISSQFIFPYYVKHCISIGSTKIKKEKINIHRDVHTSKINICLIKLLFCNEISFLLQKLSWKIYLCGWIILRFNSQWKLTESFRMKYDTTLWASKLYGRNSSVEYYIHFPRIRSIHFLSRKQNLLKQQEFFCQKMLFFIQLTV